MRAESVQRRRPGQSAQLLLPAVARRAYLIDPRAARLRGRGRWGVGDRSFEDARDLPDPAFALLCVLLSLAIADGDDDQDDGEEEDGGFHGGYRSVSVPVGLARVPGKGEARRSCRS
jgi:hypothetical protein